MRFRAQRWPAHRRLGARCWPARCLAVRSPALPEGKWQFRSLFANGRRLQRARTPNEGFWRIRGEKPAEQTGETQVRAWHVKQAWAEDGEVEVVAFLAWGDLRMQIRSVEESNHVALLSGDPQPSNREATLSTSSRTHRTPWTRRASGIWIAGKGRVLLGGGR